MKRTHFIIGATLMLAFSLTGCTADSSSSLQIGTSIQPSYTEPIDYAAHRGQQQLLAVDGGSVAYTDHGTGVPIVLLHGVPTSSWMYREIIPQLQENFRVITIDFLGYGSSDKPEGEEEVYSPRAQAGRVQTVLDHLGVDEHALLMHDMGGLVAWEMLRKQPETISHLVVLNTIVSQTGFNHPKVSPGAFTRRLLSAYSGQLTSVAIMQNTFDSLGLKGEHKLTEAECFGYVAPMREGADPALYSHFTQINETMFTRLDDTRDTFGNFQGETLVLWGAKDDVLTVDQVPILQAALSIPDENIHIYDDTAHFVAEERPDDVVREVTAFLGTN